MNTNYYQCLYSSFNAAGVGNVGTGETTLDQFTVPIGQLFEDNKALRITAFGSLANNTNFKTVKIYFGATVISIPVNVTQNTGAWAAAGVVGRTGASSQMAWMRGGVTNGSNEASNSNLVTACGENSAASIIIKVTGLSSASNDILLRGFLVEGLN